MSIQTAVDRIGRRGFVLAVLGVASISRGLTVLSETPWLDDSAVLYALWPVWLRVGIWAVAGTLAVLAVPIRPLQHVAFAALSAALAQRLAGHLWSWIAWLVPGEPGGDPWAWPWVVWWGCLVWLLWLIARWLQEGDG